MIGIVFIICGWLTYQYYSDSESIKERVLAGDGYRSKIGEEYRAVKFFVKPDWFELDTNERQNVHEVVTRIGNSQIVLTEVWLREEVNDVYFTFEVESKLSRKSGYFLTRNSGNYTGELPMPTINLLSKNEQEITLGQFAQGPGDDFSFGINFEDADLIEHGFSVEASIYFGVKYDKD